MLFYENIDKKCNLVFGNILDKDLIQNTIRKYNIEICFHLAAQIEVGYAKLYPFETWESNIRGTYNLLEAIRTCGKKIKAVIVASSDKAYGEYGIKKMPYKENYELKPIFPYDTSKACADMIAKSYASKLYNLPIIITRFSNIFGPGQLNFTALIPEAIKSCILNYKFISRSNGKNIRDYIYINDIVDVYKLLAQNLLDFQINIAEKYLMQEQIRNILLNILLKKYFFKIIKVLKMFLKTIKKLKEKF